MVTESPTYRRVSRACLVVAALVLVSGVGCQRAPAVAPSQVWSDHLLQVDRALAGNDISVAFQVLHEADTAARRSREWEALVAVAEAYQRLGEATGYLERARVRELYGMALVLASRTHSVDGVLYTAAGFRTLGDHEMVEQCLRIATVLAQTTHTPEGYRRVQAFRESWSSDRRAGSDARPPLALTVTPPGDSKAEAAIPELGRQ